MKNAKTSNHERAPLCAAFVKEMREAFGAGQVTVTYVKEGDFELGAKDKSRVVATHIPTSDIDVSLPRSVQAKRADAQGDAQAVLEVEG